MEQNTSPNSQNTPHSQEKAAPIATAKPALQRRLSLFKKIIYSIVGIVCFFGIIQIVSQNLFPENKPKSQPAAVVVTPSKVSWKSYANSKNNYSVKYSDYLKYSETRYSTVFIPKNTQSVSSDYPSLFISVIPDDLEDKKDIYNYMSPDIINKIFSMHDNESIETQSWPNTEFSTFRRLTQLPVSGKEGIIIQNNKVLKEEGMANRRVLIRNQDSTYIIGCYYRTQQELDAFRNFLDSFKFLK